MTKRGCDYSFSRPSPALLKAGGYQFAIRYLTGVGKALTLVELQGLNAAGVTVGLVYEAGEQNMLGGARQGDIDGALANHAADQLGIPRDRPIYYAFDRDDRGFPGCLPVIAAYLTAAGQGRREARVYGSIRVVDYLARPGWQTAAWSGTAVSPHAAIYQYGFNVAFQGAAIDQNLAYAADFGQHPAPHITPPAPPPPPVVTPIEENQVQVDLSMILDANGNGYVDLPGVLAKNVRSVCVIGTPDPAAAHGYSPIPRVALTIASDTHVARVIVEGGVPNGPASIRAVHA